MYTGHFLEKKMVDNEHFLGEQEYNSCLASEDFEGYQGPTFEALHLGLVEFPMLKKLPSIQLNEPVQLDFGGRLGLGGVYCSLGIHCGRLVDTYVHVNGPFALTIFGKDSWNSVAKYFFSAVTGLQISSMQVSDDDWQSLKSKESVNKTLQAMSQEGCSATASFNVITKDSLYRVPSG